MISLTENMTGDDATIKPIGILSFFHFPDDKNCSGNDPVTFDAAGGCRTFLLRLIRRRRPSCATG